MWGSVEEGGSGKTEDGGTVSTEDDGVGSAEREGPRGDVEDGTNGVVHISFLLLGQHLSTCINSVVKMACWKRLGEISPQASIHQLECIPANS